jgi:ectoine hydroxylase-related dioxygenase (phytanoyl-CoA dioxygenase family)
MAKLKHLSEEEVQQITFDWRYKGFTILDLLTEEECDEINAELETLRQQRIGTTTEDGKEWGDWDPFSYPHKISAKLEKLFCHPKVLEAVEYLMEGEVEGMQTWCYFKPPGQLGRDQHQNAFYTGCKHNEIINTSLALDNHDPENGAVWVYEGSHRLPILPIEVDEERTKTNPTFWRNERGKPCVMPEGHDFRKIEGHCRKGQVVLLHSHNIHGSEANTSNRFRRNFLGGYLKKGANFNKGGHMKREPIDLHALKAKHWTESDEKNYGGF